MPAKENHHAIRYGNKDGELKFGHIHNDNVVSAFMVRSGYDPRHYMQMDADSKRTGWTINKAPGVYSIECGDDVDPNSIALYIHAVKGDIVIKASDGNVRLEGNNVQAIATGADNSNGVITLESNEKIELKSKTIEANASAVAKFFSSGTCQVVGNAMLDIYGGLAACATGASKSKPSKYPSAPQDQFNNIGG